MGSVNLPFRQVHLDFHTSAACQDVGASMWDDLADEQHGEWIIVEKKGI